MTAVERNKATLVAREVKRGTPLRRACAQYQLRDKALKAWLLEMGLDPHTSATLRTKNVVASVDAWLSVNAGGVPCC